MMQFMTPLNRYHITSHGNGWAYEVVDQQTKDSLWFQDADACELQHQTDGFQDEDVIAQYFENLCE
jgi:hypothetical protein